jgi:hypothetical protein
VLAGGRDGRNLTAHRMTEQPGAFPIASEAVVLAAAPVAVEARHTARVRVVRNTRMRIEFAGVTPKRVTANARVPVEAHRMA